MNVCLYNYKHLLRACNVLQAAEQELSQANEYTVIHSFPPMN